MIPRYRLLFLDIDGTLVGADGVMSARTHDTLQQAQALGCVLVVCTGRNRHAALRVAAQIGGRGYGIVLNGALVFDWETGRTLRQALLPLEVAQEAVRIAHRLEMAPVWMGTEEREKTLYTDRRFPLMPRYAARNADRLVFYEDLALEMPSAPASMAAYGDDRATSRLAQDWQHALGADVRAYAAPTTAYGCWYAQLNAAGADKALAAQAVAEALEIPQEETLAVGDQVNDLGLLRWAGRGIAMGDAPPEVRVCADYVTESLAEDGAAKAIERFVLGPSPPYYPTG